MESLLDFGLKLLSSNSNESGAFPSILNTRFTSSPANTLTCLIELLILNGIGGLNSILGLNHLVTASEDVLKLYKIKKFVINNK